MRETIGNKRCAEVYMLPTSGSIAERKASVTESLYRHAATLRDPGPLPPHRYIGAYQHYLSELIPIVWNMTAGDRDQFFSAYDALLKTVFFDMSAALDAHHHANQRETARRSLDESEEQFRNVFSQAGVGLAYLSKDGHWLRTNRKFQEIVGYSDVELCKMRYMDITHPDDLASDEDSIRRLISNEISEYSKEKRYIRKDGRVVWIKVTVAPMRDSTGQTYFVSVAEDISRRKRIEEELQYLASHDSLTGLPNRNLLHDRLAQGIAQSRRNKKHLAVMMIDLDRFKNINDSLGHDAGDKVIVEAGKRLVSQVRDGDTVARLGGDEFVVVLTNLQREEDATGIAQKLLAALRLPMEMHGQELTTVGSIGISIFPKDGQDGLALLKNADSAMYKAKESEKGTFRFYAMDMNARTLDLLKLEIGLRRALERREFVLHYQPQVDVVSGKVVGVEALLRWYKPGLGLVSPEDFIPVAEESGMINDIGEWVLRAACLQQRAWASQGLGNLRVAVNLSARQFRQKALDKVVARILESTGCPAACLELEITETVIMENPETATVTLGKLRDMGVQLAIDDFGTGHSSLNYLKRFPVHKLKIDRSFVRDIPDDQDDMAIAKAVIALAHSMKLAVIAEGVEKEAQLAFLREQECDQMQGYLFSKPLPAEHLAETIVLPARPAPMSSAAAPSIRAH